MDFPADLVTDNLAR